MKDASMDITAQLVAWLLGLMSAAAFAHMLDRCASDPAYMGKWPAACAVYDLAVAAGELAGWPWRHTRRWAHER